MTREEAINNLNMISVAFVEAETKEQRKIIDDTFNMAIKALEQEPYREIEDYENEIEDLHNRLDIAEYDKERLREEVTNLETKIKALEQEPKTGHWIEVIDEIDSLGNKTWHHKCSICGNEDSGWGNYKYCPNCGARMESES